MEGPKLYINDKARKKIKGLLKRIEDDISDIDKETINDWIHVDEDVKCYIITESEIEKSFVLMRNCNCDPLKTITSEHTKPKLINYIYTFPEYRQNNLAYNLLSHIKEYDETTAFCSSEESRNLFEKAGFKVIEFLCPLPAHRYP